MQSVKVGDVTVSVEASLTGEALAARLMEVQTLMDNDPDFQARKIRAQASAERMRAKIKANKQSLYDRLHQELADDLALSNINGS